ncbi:MAG: DUF3575 domain-containing protein [Bacteroidota bacterium]
MKNLNLRALMLVVLCSGFFMNKSNAQIDVTINPIGLLFENFSVGADFALTENISVEGTIGYGSGDDSDFDFRSIPINVFGKYYFNPKNGADKFYVSAWLRFINRSYEYDDSSVFVFSDYSQTRVGVGFGLGYKVVSKGGFVFDIGLGVGRAFIDNTSFEDEDLGTIEVDWPEIMFAGKLGIGYRFGK